MLNFLWSLSIPEQGHCGTERYSDSINFKTSIRCKYTVFSLKILKGQDYANEKKLVVNTEYNWPRQKELGNRKWGWNPKGQTADYCTKKMNCCSKASQQETRTRHTTDQRQLRWQCNTTTRRVVTLNYHEFRGRDRSRKEAETLKTEYICQEKQQWPLPLTRLQASLT